MIRTRPFNVMRGGGPYKGHVLKGSGPVFSYPEEEDGDELMVRAPDEPVGPEVESDEEQVGPEEEAQGPGKNILNRWEKLEKKYEKLMNNIGYADIYLFNYDGTNVKKFNDYIDKLYKKVADKYKDRVIPTPPEISLHRYRDNIKKLFKTAMDMRKLEPLVKRLSGEGPALSTNKTREQKINELRDKYTRMKEELGAETLSQYKIFEKDAMDTGMTMESIINDYILEARDAGEMDLSKFLQKEKGKYLKLEKIIKKLHKLLKENSTMVGGMMEDGESDEDIYEKILGEMLGMAGKFLDDDKENMKPEELKFLGIITGPYSERTRREDQMTEKEKDRFIDFEIKTDGKMYDVFNDIGELMGYGEEQIDDAWDFRPPNLARNFSSPITISNLPNQ